MKPLKDFREFLNKGIVRRRTPDKARARSLVKEAEKRNRFLKEMKKIGLNNQNANYFIEFTYDVLIELIRANMLIDGFSASGEGAHEAEVAYLWKTGFKEKEIRFMNDLRYFRNGILYYGKDFDAGYGERVLKFLRKTYPVLLINAKGS